MRYSYKVFAIFFAIALASAARATTIFSDNLNSYSGNQNNQEYATSLPVAYGGTVSGWNRAGGNALHAVELTAGTSPNWAIMFYADNTMTLASAISGSNTLGSSYDLTFDYGTACYSYSSQCTTATDGLTVELLDPGRDIVASGTFTLGAYASGNYNLQEGLVADVSYTGTGSGNLTIAFATTAATRATTTFGGEIDNVALVDNSVTTPEPAAWTMGLLGITAIAAARFRKSRRNDSLHHPLK
jgi:hypothetical protein